MAGPVLIILFNTTTSSVSGTIFRQVSDLKRIFQAAVEGLYHRTRLFSSMSWWDGLFMELLLQNIHQPQSHRYASTQSNVEARTGLLEDFGVPQNTGKDLLDPSSRSCIAKGRMQCAVRLLPTWTASDNFKYHTELAFQEYILATRTYYSTCLCHGYCSRRRIQNVNRR
jgi:hypothetical protein